MLTREDNHTDEDENGVTGESACILFFLFSPKPISVSKELTTEADQHVPQRELDRITAAEQNQSIKSKLEVCLEFTHREEARMSAQLSFVIDFVLSVFCVAWGAKLACCT